MATRTSFLVANIEGLNPGRHHSKMGMLRELIEDRGVLVVALTESHLNPGILDAEVQMEGFQMYRGDRANGRRKGGVITYLRDDLAVDAVLLASGSNGTVEYLVLHICELNLVLANVYRPPTSSGQDFVPVMETIKQEFVQLGDPSPSLILCGDFNFPRARWIDRTMVGGAADERRQTEFMFELCDELLLTQVVDVSTREDSVLDLVFLNNEELLYRVVVEDTIMSDHRLVFLETTLGFSLSAHNHRRTGGGFEALNFFHENTQWDEIVRELNEVNWRELLGEVDVEQMHDVTLDCVLSICTRHTPRKRVPQASRKIPRDRRILMRKRNKLRKRVPAAGTGKDAVMARILQVEELLSLSHDEERRREERKAVEAIRTNPKYFFRYAKSKSQIRSRVGPLRRGEELVGEPQDMSEMLRVQYDSVFSLPLPMENLPGTPNDRQVEELGPELNDIDFAPEDFVEMVRELPAGSSPGPDGVPAILLKRTGGALGEPLYILWRESLDCGRVPQDLKTGKITPIFKGGDRSVPGNYRPVALTSHCIKVFEKIVVRRLVEYMELNELFNESQHGFRRQRSCLSQLLAHYHGILEALERGLDMDVVYLDFAKAFDKVDHGVLLAKLSALGIHGQLYTWIRSFLTGRRQYVAVEGAMSATSDVSSGVPQGSVLGPVLFLVHIADISGVLRHSVASSFADDTRVCKTIKSTLDCELLQEDLEAVYRWAVANNMKFNGEKFELLRYTASGEVVECEYRDPQGAPIQRKSELRDLGVVMGDTAGFNTQRSEVATRGRQRMGWILRTFATREAFPMLTLYKALVLPLLEYCCQLWCPTAIGQIRQLEAVQRTFTSRVAGLAGYNYWERLQQLGLYSLERRRERYMIIYVWKIVCGLAPNVDGRDGISTHTSERRGRFCVVPPVNGRALQRVQTLRENSLLVRGPRLFNCLPASLRAHQGTLSSFKAQLDGFLLTVPDQPRLPHYHQPAASNSVVAQVEWLRSR